MSTSNQNNGKKASSTNNSVTNTPSSTPVSTIANSSGNQVPVQSTSPPNNAPKYGTLVPNRIFVGGIAGNTTEAELLQLFSNYGTVKAAKIIQDRAGVSKGYGFITFESEEEAKRLQREADNIVLRERKLNIAPAIKKQPFGRPFDAASPPTIAPGGPAQYFIPAGGMPFYQGGVAYYAQPPPPPPPTDPNVQQPSVYQPSGVYPAQSGPPQTAAYPSLVYPTPPLYVPQQYPYQPVPYEYNYYPNGGPQYMVGNQGATQSQISSMQSPSSPPRTPCYNQSLPFTADAMYYNMPLYGGPMESAPFYQDTLDLANGNIAEENSVGHITQDLEPIQQFNNFNNFTATTALDSSINADNLRQPTPTVSILTDHKEKDLTSMQSGRCKKQPVDSTSIPLHENDENCLNVASNITANSCSPLHSVIYTNGPEMFVTTPKNYYVGNTDPTSSYKSNYYTNACTKLTRPKQFNRSHFSNSYYIGPHTVDENRNEEKKFSTNVATSPSVPYFPITQQGSLANKQNIRRLSTRPFHNNNNNFKYFGSYTSNIDKTAYNRSNNSLVRNNNFFRKNKSNEISQACNIKIESNKEAATANNIEIKPANTSDVDIRNATEFQENTANRSILNLSHPPLQIPHVATQNFNPPARRNKRSTRRNTNACQPLNEIGAGDAPLPPTADVADACSKIENLKL